MRMIISFIEAFDCSIKKKYYLYNWSYRINGLSPKAIIGAFDLFFEGFIIFIFLFDFSLNLQCFCIANPPYIMSSNVKDMAHQSERQADPLWCYNKPFCWILKCKAIFQKFHISFQWFICLLALISCRILWIYWKILSLLCRLNL